MFRYMEEDGSEYWVANLRQNYKGGVHTLGWDQSNGCGVLIVKSTLGEDVVSNLSDICEKMSAADYAPSNNFFEIENGLSVKILTVADSLNRSSDVSGKGRYYVFACKQEGSDYYIYPPTGSSSGKIYADISARIEIKTEEIKKEVTEGRLFNKKTVEVGSGYYKVSFPQDFDVTQYKTGELYYAVGGVKIPITGIMISGRDIYIKSESKPEIKAENNSMEVIEL